MTYDSLVNRGDYFSAHYLAEVFPKDLKSGLLAAWKTREEEAKSSDSADQESDPEALPVTPRLGLRALRRPYFRTRAFFAEAAVTHDDATTYDAPEWRERAASLNSSVLRALGYDAKPRTLTVSRADHTYEIPVAHAEPGLVAVDCGWAAEPDAALDADGSGRLLTPVQLDSSASLRTGSKLASFLFASEDAPRYVLLLAGGVIVLADRAAWGEGRYLAASLDTALDRNNTKDGQELDTLAALFGADSLRAPEEGGENPLAGLVDKSTKHAVGVSSELRDGLRESVELIANEVLARIAGHEGVRLEDVKELPELSRQLTRESLRYLYRILFLLYAEARPELGILPSDYPEYHQGYGLGRLGELVAERDLVGEKAREGVYLYESLDLLFSKVQEGYRPRRTHGVGAKDSEDVGLRFEPLHSKLFEPESIRLIGAESVKDPRHDDDSDEGPRYLDTRLRNATLYKVLRKLMLTRGRKGERGGFISYAQLGINQLGAVYEGLMSYAGFIAGEELYEVAKNGDPKDGSWLIPSSKADEYADSVFVCRRNEETGADVRVRYRPGSFVYRLSGRDRQTSASYYTPESLTKVTVQLALQHRLDQDDTVTEARELLDWKICEPALGSGAFLNEAINQVAAEYLRRRQDETGRAIDTEQYPVELQKAKAYIALHNSYGVDLNSTAVELAEVSLWLNTMHPGMEAPWFGLHLRRGNSLIGGRREIYSADRLKKGGWLGATPERFPLTEASAGLPTGSVHHFLLPAKEWGAVAAEKEAKALAPEEAKALGAWRKAITKSPSAKQTARLQGLARRAEYLWQLVVRRLEISERDISRKIDVWGAEPEWLLRQPVEAVQREEVLADLEAVDTPYWRLKTLMDAWCALWFWPVQEASLLNGTNPRYRQAAELAEQSAVYEVAVSGAETEGEDEDESTGVLMSWEEEALPGFGTEAKQLSLTQESVAKRRMGRRKESITERRREVIPLANLDDWLDFAESLLGTQDVPAESLIAEFESLTELTPYEDALPDLMGMDRSYWLESRFPWAARAKDIATQQGFFHWELEYAQIFERGGYDLQVGNPPWVRPRWQEDMVLSELDPWFTLTEKPSVSDWRLHKTGMLSSTGTNYYLTELASSVATMAYTGGLATYPHLAGTQTDLYRAFMCKSWANMHTSGTVGLIHPDTHFSGSNESSLRRAAYKHLTFHAHFSNRLLLFTEVEWTRQFGIHIYGSASSIDFRHISWLFSATTLTASLDHDHKGELPGIKNEGSWDIRPHGSRIIHVTQKLLDSWSKISSGSEEGGSATPLLYPVTSGEQGAIDALAAADRVSSHSPSIYAGFHEKAAREAGMIKWGTTTTPTPSEVILQGPHFGIATPWNKQPDIPCRLNRDWSAWDLSTIPKDLSPRTNYVRACNESTFGAAQEQREGVPYSNFYRLAWRKMIPFDTERSLFAAMIPPGPTHIHSVHSAVFPSLRQTALAAGFWAALPLDYVLRVTGRANLQVGDAPGLPMGEPTHPLATPLILRALRLNCLTNAYAPLWDELFHPTWPGYEDWAHAWPNIASLAGSLSDHWEYGTPLRSEFERRAALVELDALVSVWLGITADQLVAIYKSRYPVLSDYEAGMNFDANGRKIARNHNTYGHGQTKETYPALLDHLDNPATTPPPEGYTAPFYKADRETEMRAAHAYFSARLDAEIAAGRWTPTVKADA
ncbi:class I SAM-dependent DNA methyltransferase [Streptomyces sp. NBC_01362]|uniref:class I SAM-dependent DNA methyltransferase n=1 Tax=Streptomyces sp. NBC_01362 TaxID=2903839 RepID=UPI002E323004|nr:class I SAM-dependent DNA methyltransferase [Streptomyces sp. NBC_01362]